SFPPHQGGDPLPAFKSGALAFPQTARTSRMVAIVEPGAVVGSENYQGVFPLPGFLQSFEDLAYAPVYFHHHIPKQALFGFSFEVIGYIQRNMWHGMWQINKKRLILFAFNKINGTVGKFRAKLFLVLGTYIWIYDGFIFK